MSDNLREISDNDLEEVVGGIVDDEHINWLERFPVVKKKCIDCGKTFKCRNVQVIENITTTWRRDWYSQFCFECAKKHPYPGRNGNPPLFLLSNRDIEKVYARVNDESKFVKNSELGWYNIWED